MEATDEMCRFIMERGPASRKLIDDIKLEMRESCEAGRWAAIFDYLYLRETGQLGEPEILTVND